MIFVLSVGKEDIGKCMMKLCYATTVLFSFFYNCFRLHFANIEYFMKSCSELLLQHQQDQQCNSRNISVKVTVDVSILKLVFDHWTCQSNKYIIKVKNRNTKKRCEICLKLTMKTPEQRQ